MPDRSTHELFSLYSRFCSDAETALGYRCDPEIALPEFATMLDQMTVEHRAQYEQLLRRGFNLPPNERADLVEVIASIRSGRPRPEIKMAVDSYFRRRELETRPRRTEACSNEFE